MRAPDAIQRGDFLDYVPWRRKVTHADLILLGIQVLLPPRQWRRLTDLKPGIHPPKTRQRARQRGADQEAGPTGILEKGWIDVWRVDKEIRTEKFARGRRRELGQVICEIFLGVAPGEVGVRLREAHLRQTIHQLWAGKSLGQEKHIRMPGPNIRDHPVPERQRLGVWIVHTENADAVLAPEQDHIAQRQPQ